MNELENINESMVKKTRKSKKSRNNIYNYFDEYRKEELKKVIEALGDKELAILHRKYGEDFANPVIGTLSCSDKKYLDNAIFPKIKRMLESNKNKKESEQTKRCEEENLPLSMETMDFDKETTVINETRTESELANMDEYIKAVEIFNIDTLKEITKTKSMKEIVVLSLALGYVDDKYFFANSIANFLGMEQTEVDSIIKDGVAEYKVRLNEIIDQSLNKMIETKTDNNSKVYVKTFGKKEK